MECGLVPGEMGLQPFEKWSLQSISTQFATQHSAHVWSRTGTHLQSWGSVCRCGPRGTCRLAAYLAISVPLPQRALCDWPAGISWVSLLAPQRRLDHSWKGEWRWNRQIVISAFFSHINMDTQASLKSCHLSFVAASLPQHISCVPHEVAVLSHTGGKAFPTYTCAGGDLLFLKAEIFWDVETFRCQVRVKVPVLLSRHWRCFHRVTKY